MTTQEAINFTLSDPRVAAGRAAYQQNKSIFEAEKNSLQQQINAAQSALDGALKKGSSKQEDLDQLNSNLEKARAAYNDSRKRWGPAYYGQGASLTAALPFAPYGTTLTTEQKQAQSPLYNPLYDPSSAEYKSSENLATPEETWAWIVAQRRLNNQIGGGVTSGPVVDQYLYGPVGPANPQNEAMPAGFFDVLWRLNSAGKKEYYRRGNNSPSDAANAIPLSLDEITKINAEHPNPTKPTSPIIQNPLAPATTPKVQMPSVSAPKANNNLNSSTSNLLQAVQGQNAPVPSYSTPTAGPNLLAQPKIELPQMFQDNFNAPSTTPPNAPNGITMPNWAGQKPKGGFGSNWNDLLSVAYNRQPR